MSIVVRNLFTKCLLIMFFIFVPNVVAESTVKNIIVMVPDGCSHSIQAAARWYKGEALNLDSIVSGAVKTHMVNSVITGSAAAATAFSSGFKTSARFVGIGARPDDAFQSIPEDIQYKPLATVLEIANIEGKGVGLIATSRVTHATLASYAAHVLDRGWDNEIMEQLVYNKLDVVFGGGKRYLLTKDDGGNRSDGENLKAVLLERGYQFIETRDELLSFSGDKVWGLFADNNMSAEIDRKFYKSTEPSLAEMTDHAINILKNKENGFFLLVEGSQIDWGGHANDPVHMITDFLAFDEAVGVALNYARSNDETLLLVFSDHDTGGLAIGNKRSDRTYSATTADDLVNPIKGMKITAASLSEEIKKETKSFTNSEVIKSKIKEFWSIGVTDEDVDEIIRLVDTGLQPHHAIGSVISKNYTLFGWISHGHTGVDVPLWSYGPNRPMGLFDNTELANIVANAFAFNMDYYNANLYVDVRNVFPDNYVIDKSDSKNPVLKIGDFTLPNNKDLLINKNGKKYKLHGLVIYSPAANWCENKQTGAVSEANAGGCDGDKENEFEKHWESAFIPLDAQLCIKGDCDIVVEELSN